MSSLRPMPVATPVGWMVLTRIQCGASWVARTCMSQTRPRVAAVHDMREGARSPSSPTCWTCRHGRGDEGGRAQGGAPPRRPAEPCSTPRDGATRSSSPIGRCRHLLPGGPATGAIPSVEDSHPQRQGHRAAQPPLRWLRLQWRLGRAGAHGPGPARPHQGPGPWRRAGHRRAEAAALHDPGGPNHRGSRQVTLHLQHNWRWAAELAAAFARLQALPLLS